VVNAEQWPNYVSKQETEISTPIPRPKTLTTQDYLEADASGAGVDPGGPQLPQRCPVHGHNLARMIHRGLCGKESVVASLNRQLGLVDVVNDKSLPRVERPALSDVA